MRIADVRLPDKSPYNTSLLSHTINLVWASIPVSYYLKKQLAAVSSKFSSKLIMS